MAEARVLDELETRLKAGYSVDGQAVNVVEFEPEAEPEREYLRVKFRLGTRRTPGFFYTFDAQNSVEACLGELAAFIRSHAEQAAIAPSSTKHINS